MADTPGWRVRVVPNLYPAFERQEVVVHAPQHVRSLAELDGAQLALVADAWRQRSHQAVSERFGYVQALVNEGRAAGATLSHSHSQLVWLREAPPAVVSERPRLAARTCALCRLIRREVVDGARVVSQRDGVVLLAAYAGRAPYEMLIAPSEHLPDAFRADAPLGAALELLAEALRELHTLEGRVPANAWLHDGDHWHLELLPRLTTFAGLELGAGYHVNAVPPEAAAAALRAART